MKIGLISDTHGFLDPKVSEYFDGCDEIWHAGDIGTLMVAQELEKLQPLQAVYGNIDGSEVRSRFGEDSILDREGFKILLTHIAGTPPRYNARIRHLIAKHKPEILVCGHSHILKIMSDVKMKILYINPGSAGKQGFHHMRTLVRFDLTDHKISAMQVIELGKRSSLGGRQNY